MLDFDYYIQSQQNLRNIEMILNSLSESLVNRFCKKSYSLTSNLDKYKYHQFKNRTLHCLMDTLVNYIEVDLANFHCCVLSDEAKRPYKYPVGLAKWKYLFSKWRSPEAGMDQLEWLAEAKGNQYAKDLMSIYSWWTYVRPRRADPLITSGYAMMLSKYQEHLNNTNVKFDYSATEVEEIYKRYRDISNSYLQEDTKYLILLIENRSHIHG